MGNNKIELKNGTMQFLSCSIPFPNNNGLHIVSCGCGQGKTTMIMRLSGRNGGTGFWWWFRRLKPLMSSGRRLRNGTTGLFLSGVAGSRCFIPA